MRWIWNTQKNCTRCTTPSHLAPERMIVQGGSEYQRNLIGVEMAPNEVEKLVPNLRNKARYVLHYRILQFFLSLRMRLTKIHRALRFRQSPWMEPYIQMNTELRKKAASEQPLQVDEQISLWEDHGEPAESG